MSISMIQELLLTGMAIWVVKFPREGYKITVMPLVGRQGGL